ncbi:hypothetical protein VPJ68_02510 [Parabacteroides distasonis]
MMNVSKQTENFVDCMKLMQALYTKVYSSLEELYSEEDTERIIADNFIMEFGALEKRVESLVIMSMKERMNDLTKEEI